ncbi:DnaB-like helicase N-terminal domain-containing protein [Kitasatospora herbaricolor]|uniref:DnaB-like helicase N-terminal domain-containing protein n=1 Tax=Kitasatospora herbaricolor TaxID=68217 RepID=UPI0036DAE5CB
MSGPEAYCEEALLSSVLQDPSRALEIRNWLRAEDFANPWRREIYRVLMDHHLYAHPTALSSGAAQRAQVLGRLVMEDLHARAGADGWQVSGGDWQQVAAYLTSLPAGVPDAANAAQYGRVVAQASLQRTRIALVAVAADQRLARLYGRVGFEPLSPASPVLLRRPRPPGSPWRPAPQRILRTTLT